MTGKQLLSRQLSLQHFSMCLYYMNKTTVSQPMVLSLITHEGVADVSFPNIETFFPLPLYFFLAF